MKWLRYEHKGKVFYGFLTDAGLVAAAAGLPWEGAAPTGHTAALSDVTVLAPCQPEKIVCVGVNYLDHAQESNRSLPPEPLIFLKPPTAVIGPGEAIVHPDISDNVHYEGELAIVIKKRCRAVKKDEAAEYIFGCTCANDVTARDLQRKDIQFTRAKSFDTFCPLGPYIETGFDFAGGEIKTRLNGRLVQSSNINRLIFKVPEIIEFISKVMTLCPGDVILTGTPGGVGRMQDGDLVEVEIEGIGVLKNTVIGG
ncbi:MAG: fumarylacetoacetate hydrolase family protein [Acidaminococcales bacterium]|jgi:2-keto-4-pentenoate hydratase/2-oxohepta-3-ene-1,7-dioic acid hydratase in catechol pathway|nr:fumarylacetoacetate hydrolase family protein [Acidaminococcales bacterium]